MFKKYRLYLPVLLFGLFIFLLSPQRVKAVEFEEWRMFMNVELHFPNRAEDFSMKKFKIKISAGDTPIEFSSLNPNLDFQPEPGSDWYVVTDSGEAPEQYELVLKVPQGIDKVKFEFQSSMASDDYASYLVMFEEGNAQYPTGQSIDKGLSKELTKSQINDGFGGGDSVFMVGILGKNDFRLTNRFFPDNFAGKALYDVQFDPFIDKNNGPKPESNLDLLIYPDHMYTARIVNGTVFTITQKGVDGYESVAAHTVKKIIAGGEPETAIIPFDSKENRYIGEHGFLENIPEELTATLGEAVETDIEIVNIKQEKLIIKNSEPNGTLGEGFEYEVKLKRPQKNKEFYINNEYKAVKKASDDSPTEELSFELDGDSHSITLKHGESLEIDKIPYGVEFEIIQTKNKEYTTSVAAKKVIDGADEKYSVTENDDTTTKKVTGTMEDATYHQIEFINRLIPLPPPTGIRELTSPYVLLAVGAVAGISVLYALNTKLRPKK